MVKLRLSTLLLVLAAFLGLAMQANSGVPSSAGRAAPSPERASQSAYSTISHPAAYYCQSLGYSYQVVSDSGQGQRGVCSFPDGSSCDAWQFLQGECRQELNYCASQGMRTVVVGGAGDLYSRKSALCVGQDGEEIGRVTELMDFERNLTRPGCDTQPVPELEGYSLFEQPSAQPGPLSMTSAPLPPSFDWRTYESADWMTPVKDQGSCGSCWAFSAVGAAEAAYNIASGSPGLDLDLSEQYLVSDCSYSGSCCGGWHVPALNFMLEQGIPDEGCLPYVDGYGCSCWGTGVCTCTYAEGGACSYRTCSDRCPDWADRLYSLDGVASYPLDQYDRQAIQRALVEVGPLSVGINMNGYWDGNIFRCENDIGANHMVVISGYDDPGGYWIVKNSWGSGYGDGGYFSVGYGECAIEDYVSQPIVNSRPLPDLVVESISYSPANPAPGQLVEFSIKIKNQGSSLAPPASFRLSVYDHQPGSCTDGSDIWSWSVDGLDAGEVREVTYPRVFDSAGAYEFWVYVDSFCSIEESDEDNNLSAPVSIGVITASEVEIDIKPGSYPNVINCQNENALVPVAVLTTGSLDALSLDHTTVTLEGAGEFHINKKSGLPVKHVGDFDNDGDLDLIFHFRLGDTLLSCRSTEAVLKGKTIDGLEIQGRDSLRTVRTGG